MKNWKSFRNAATAAGLNVVVTVEAPTVADQFAEARDADGHLCGLWDGFAHTGVVTHDATRLESFLMNLIHEA